LEHAHDDGTLSEDMCRAMRPVSGLPIRYQSWGCTPWSSAKCRRSASSRLGQPDELADVAAFLVSPEPASSVQPTGWSTADIRPRSIS